MNSRFLLPIVGSTIALVALGCASPSRSPIIESYGSEIQLPEPKSSLIPTVNIAPAKGWPVNAMPAPVAGLRVQAFARTLNILGGCKYCLMAMYW